ncbi:protein FRIGIDA-ESSENTIAL 1 isoform X2 [Durio zibethinus]|uniref:Protein FRIGIDA-ESSENTIAL 1 isoform X2 n=1 Tax=Durio zibethinus TaxID=66656 RepID=A0A6P5WWE1_DURZI|nr:protein FRIGIDA-ESSENTIAL 1 isoform X2 [Durio zibethinus]
MPLSNSAAIPCAEKDDERGAASTTEREINSSDMEIDDEDDEGEEDLQGSSNRNDASNIVESKGQDGRLGSDSSIPGKFEKRIPSKTFNVGESSANFKFSSLPKESLVTQREDLCTNYEEFKYPTSGKQPAKQNATQDYAVSVKDARVILDRKAPEDRHEQHINSKSRLVTNEIMYETTNLSSVTGKEVAINEITSIPIRYHSGGVKALGFEEKCKQMDAQTEDDKMRIKSRSAAFQTSTGSLSPRAAFNSGNKRPALICDFFAKGWCVKGSSCRFLHIKDSVNNPTQQPEEDVATANGKRAVQLDEGFRNAAERSKSPGSTDSLPSTVGNKIALSSHFFPERMLPLGHDENQRLHPFHEINKFPLLQSKDKSMDTSPFCQQFSSSTDDLRPSKDGRQNNIGQNLPASLNDRGSSTYRNSFLPEYISSLSGSVTSLGNISSENQSYRVSTWLASLPFSSSRACSLGAHKVSDNDRDHRTSRLSSLLQGSSPFSSSEPENFPVNDIVRDPLRFAENRIKISSDDWEPSIPFRPSFFVTYGVSSPQSQYDPLRDSIDLPNAGERFLKFSFSCQVPSPLNVACPPTYADSTSTGPLVPECNGDKKTASCHNRYRENVVNGKNYTSGKDSLTTDADDGTFAADTQNGTLAREEISSVASHVKDISKTNKIDTGRDGGHQSDGSRLKVDKVIEKNEIYDEHKANGYMLKESKAMRHFRVALVDLIKELLKPTWRDGHLSKDAHNTIVKKAVDKVLGTIQPHQIPITFESVKQYLSSSQPKIARLVEHVLS